MNELASLVSAAQQGDLAAFNQIVSRFQDMAYASAYAWLGDFELAQDAAQEAFLDAYMSLPYLREPAAFPGWFRKIVFKHSDRFTRGKRLTTMPIETVVHISDTTGDPVSSLEAQQLKRLIQDGIATLPEKQRLATSLFYMGQYSQQEIADFLEVPVSTVKKRLYSARKRLQERMEAMVQDYLHETRPSKDTRFSKTISFFLAMQMGDITQVKRLLKADPELIHATCEWDEALAREMYYWPTGALPLHWAVIQGCKDLVELLLDHQAEVDVGLGWGGSPLHAAAIMHETEIAQLLLDRGAAIDGLASNGFTALHQATLKGYTDFVQLLLARDADVQVRDSAGRTALYWANLEGHPEITSLLNAHGANPETGYTGEEAAARQIKASSPPTWSPPQSIAQATGVIARVADLTVDVDFAAAERPAIGNQLNVANDESVILEVEAHLSERLVRCVALSTTDHLKLGLTVIDTGQPIRIPVGEQIMGRILNAAGQPIDSKGDFSGPGWPLLPKLSAPKEQPAKPQIWETGIKIIDLLAPLPRGGQIGVFDAEYGVGMLVVLNELMYTINTQYGGYSVWVGDEGRPGVQKVEQTFRKVRVEDKAAAVFSLQADTPTMRQRLLRTAATILDYFRAAGCQEGLLLIEAALASNGQLDGLDTFTGTTDQGAISAIVFGSWEVYQALKEKADLADLSAVLTFSTARARAGLYPALDPLKLTSTMLTEARVGKRHICLAKQTVELLKRYSVLDEVVTVEGIEALRGEDRQVAIRARRLDRFLTQPFFIAEAFSANPGKFLPLAQTLDGCEAIINGQYDNVLEEAFQFIGSVEEIGDGNSK